MTNTPSKRNIEIYRLVLETNKSLEEIGKMFATADNPNGISKSRVSQIVSQVKKWLESSGKEVQSREPLEERFTMYMSKTMVSILSAIEHAEELDRSKLVRQMIEDHPLYQKYQNQQKQ